MSHEGNSKFYEHQEEIKSEMQIKRKLTSEELFKFLGYDDYANARK